MCISVYVHMVQVYVCICVYLYRCIWYRCMCIGTWYRCMCVYVYVCIGVYGIGVCVQVYGIGVCVQLTYEARQRRVNVFFFSFFLFFPFSHFSASEEGCRHHVHTYWNMSHIQIYTHCFIALSSKQEKEKKRKKTHLGSASEEGGRQHVHPTCSPLSAAHVQKKKEKKITFESHTSAAIASNSFFRPSVFFSPMSAQVYMYH